MIGAKCIDGISDHFSMRTIHQSVGLHVLRTITLDLKTALMRNPPLYISELHFLFYVRSNSIPHYTRSEKIKEGHVSYHS